MTREPPEYLSFFLETPWKGAPAAPGEASAPAEPFEAHLARVLPGAYGVACALTGDRADADDLLQEAALLAFRAFASFTPGRDFKAWFYRILTNRHYERLRRSTRRPATVAFEETSDHERDDHRASRPRSRPAVVGSSRPSRRSR